MRRDERETSESGQHVPLFCPAGGNLREQTEAILESLSTLHRLLREQQRSLSLPLRPWGTPVGVGPHVKNSLDAAPPRGRRGQVTVSPGPPPELDEFPRLLPKNSNRKVPSECSSWQMSMKQSQSLSCVQYPSTFSSTLYGISQQTMGC